MSGKFIPPVLRGEKSKECRKCFVKEGCYSLCAGLETQRDCQNCYHQSICNKSSWEKTTQDYFIRLTDALIEEENEENREQYLYARGGILGALEKDNLINRGFACITTKILSQAWEEGVYITEFSQYSRISRFRRGDLARAYDLQATHETVTLFHSVTITNFTRSTITLESVNKLPSELCIVPSSSSTNARTGRRALYRTTEIGSKLLTLIRDSLSQEITLPGIETDTIELQSPLQSYNSTQVNAILQALSTKDLLLIQGPAGTGKTSVIVELINQLHQTNNSVLCSAFTNMAIDNVGLQLKTAKIPFIRLGSPHSMDPGLRDFSAINQPDLFRQVVEKTVAVVVLSTTSTIARKHYEDFWFDYVLLDEAAQMTEPDALKALLLGEKAIMVGDHAQLQPIILSQKAQQMNLHVSLFERLVSSFDMRFIRLIEQYRMNDEILEFPNERFYDGILRSANEDIGKQQLGEFSGNFVNNQAYEVLAIHDPEHIQSQQVNHSESVVVIAVLSELLKFNPRLKSEDIGVVTPFRAQVAHLRGLLPQIHIDTVDRYQGSEREVIIYSTITMQEIPILTDPRRLNVALTRGKKKMLILLTNPSDSRKISLFDDLYHDALKRNVVRPIFTEQIEKLKDITILERNRSSILQHLSIEHHPINAKIYSNYDDKFDPSIGTHVNIFFKAIQLAERQTVRITFCPLCMKEVTHGIQCIGCSHWFHKSHLLIWLEKNHDCPICKNTLNVIQT
jgi:DNA polymerase III delta prime subunit